MKRLVMTIALTIIATGVTSAAAAAGDLENNDFESWTGDVPDYWTNIGEDVVAMNDTESITGKCVQSNYTGIKSNIALYQFVDLTPAMEGKTITFAFYYKVDGANANNYQAQASLWFFNGSSRLIGQDSYSSLVNGSLDYQQVSTTGSVPANATRVRCAFSVENKDYMDIAYVDNATLTGDAISEYTVQTLIITITTTLLLVTITVIRQKRRKKTIKG